MKAYSSLKASTFELLGVPSCRTVQSTSLPESALPPPKEGKVPDGFELVDFFQSCNGVHIDYRHWP